MTPKKRPEGPRLSQQEAYTLRDLDQIKVLADPLRIRILEAFCQERTTKQVAELLGEKPTKLYHHVETLERVGLISPSRTRQNRGTLEKYYLAVARTFRADSRAFAPKGKQIGENEKSAAIRRMLSTIFQTTSAEAASLLDQGETAAKTIEEEGIVSFLEIRGSKAQLNAIRDKLDELVRSLVADDTAEDAEPGRYRFTLAYFPLPESDPAPRGKV